QIRTPRRFTDSPARFASSLGRPLASNTTVLTVPHNKSGGETPSGGHACMRVRKKKYAAIASANTVLSISTIPIVPHHIRLREPNAPGGRDETSTVRGPLILRLRLRAPRAAAAASAGLATAECRLRRHVW